MNRPPLVLALLTSLLAAGAVRAQAPAVPCSTAPAAAPCNASAPPGALALVDGKALETSDLEADARKELAGLDAELARIAREALEDEIRDRLLAAEARREASTPDRLYLVEIHDKTARPTSAQVQAEYRRRKELSSRKYEQVREWLTGVLFDEAEARRYAQWARRFEGRWDVRRVADPTAEGADDATAAAFVAENPITFGDLRRRMAPKVYATRRSAADTREQAVEAAVRRQLLRAQAQRAGLTADEYLAREVAPKVRHPTDADVAQALERLGQPNADAETREDVRKALEDLSREAAETEYIDALKKSAGVWIAPPDAPLSAPVLAIETEGSPSRGAATPLVTVVEFGDFQCPPCRNAKPLVDRLVELHGDRVRVVFRQFPLSMHPNARGAAEAALAAHAQGKFWPYADALFADQKALDAPALRRRAAALGLDVPRFERDLATKRYAEAVERDIRAGRRYAIPGTPTFYIDGVMFEPSDSDLDAFEKAVARRVAEAASADRPAAGAGR